MLAMLTTTGNVSFFYLHLLAFKSLKLLRVGCLQMCRYMSKIERPQPQNDSAHWVFPNRPLHSIYCSLFYKLKFTFIAVSTVLFCFFFESKSIDNLFYIVFPDILSGFGFVVCGEILSKVTE